MLRTMMIAAMLVLSQSSAFAWGAKGHELVGHIADNLLKPNASAKVSSILGFPLETAGPWLDCVKSVYKQSDGSFLYKKDPAHPEWTAACPAFETPDEQARMQDYVARNWTDCVYYNGDRGCHETYHFADVAIQHDHYDRSYVGTSDHDIVSVINAAIDVLQGKRSPSPISIKDQKEALFILAHLIGDLHQPLHVGSVYLNAQGKEVDPDVGQYDQATETIGGNKIFDGGKNFHAEWDAIPKYSSTTVDAIIGEARAVPSTNGSIDTWASTWAGDTIVQSQHAFDGATFEAEDAKGWPVDFASQSAHLSDENKEKGEQLAKGGARLAETLNAVWP